MGSTDLEKVVRDGYGWNVPVIELGAAAIGGKTDPAAQVRLPLQMTNRHGFVAGATGTGKTKTLQLLTEQLSDAGVPGSSTTKGLTRGIFGTLVGSPARRRRRRRR